MRMWCNRDCFNCRKDDCDCEDVTAAERQEQNEQDTDIIGSRKHGRARVIWKYNHSEKGKEVQRKYAQSDKGKAAKKKYIQSDKGRAAQGRYAASDLGKETEKRKTQQRIASGKNAEKCRAYYYRKKERKKNEKY